ncbi:MAG: DMT family transporter [Firmicutes bacterium]|nr:DMT family transporter [Bacillota bacterium]
MDNKNFKKKNLTGSFMLLLTAFIWGTAFVAQSKGMDYIGPFTFNFVRSVIAGIVLIPIIVLFKKAEKNKKQNISLKQTLIGGIACGVMLCLGSAFQQSGIVLTTAGKAGFITALYIVIVPVLEFIIYKRASGRIWLCVFIAVCGFYLLCIKENFTIGKGDLLVLVCALCFAGHIMVIDIFAAKNTDGMIMSCIQFFTAAVIFLLFMYVLERPDIKSIINAWRPIMYAGVMSSCIGYTLQILGQRRTPPAAATLLMSLESVFAALSGWLILGEKMLPKELTGCVLVFAAVILAQLPKNNTKTTEEK